MPRVRQFRLYTGPGVADPAWFIPVTEVGEDGKIIARYSGLEEVKFTISEMEKRLAEVRKKQGLTV